MEFFVYDCPHCGAQEITFDAQLIYKENLYTASYGAVCRKCRFPISVKVSTSVEIAHYDGLHNIFEYCRGEGLEHVLYVWPRPEAPVCPAYCPPDVERSFLQGLAAVKVSPDGAIVLMRRCLEQAIKHIHADGKGPLYKRIEAAHEAGHLTKSLKDWAHHIRLIGNDAAHDAPEDADEAEVESLVDFTRLVLTYLFTLPGEVATKIPREVAEA